MKYLVPYAALKGSLKLHSAKGQLKIDMTFDEFLALIKKFLLAVPIDEVWYCERYPDVAEAIAAGTYSSARQHFVDHGYFEGRHPFELEIDEAWYLQKYPDIAECVANGVLESARAHFVNNGYIEGRLPSAL